MTTSTIERAFEVARSGRARDFGALKALLKDEGCRAVDALLAPRLIRGHLEAICAAVSRPAQADAPLTKDSL